MTFWFLNMWWWPVMNLPMWWWKKSVQATESIVGGVHPWWPPTFLGGILLVCDLCDLSWCVIPIITIWWYEEQPDRDDLLLLIVVLIVTNALLYRAVSIVVMTDWQWLDRQWNNRPLCRYYCQQHYYSSIIPQYHMYYGQREAVPVRAFGIMYCGEPIIVLLYYENVCPRRGWWNSLIPNSIHREIVCQMTGTDWTDRAAMNVIFI